MVFDNSTGLNKQRQLDLNSRGVELEANASFDNGFSLIARQQRNDLNRAARNFVRSRRFIRRE